MKKNKDVKPLVTVLMTAYNADKFIVKAVDSIVNQTYKNLEIIIVDDGSTDKTWGELKKFKKKDSRIKICRLKKNCGPSKASNIGISRAGGKYLARMDADDIATTDRIEKQVKFLEKNPEVVLLGGQCKLIDEKGKVIGEKDFPLKHKEICNSLFSINPIQHPSCIVNTSLLPKNFVYYHNHSILAHDLELVFELSQHGELANLQDQILYYRQYPNSLSLSNPKRTFKATMNVRHKALKKYHYKPTLKGWLTHFAQLIVVNLLPRQVIYPLFAMVRGLKERGAAIAKPQLAKLRL